MRLIIIFLLLPITAYSSVYSTEDWISMYLSPCNKNTPNNVCFDKTKKNFKSLAEYQEMIIEHLDKYKLPRWLGTIPVIESEFVDHARSNSGAVGLWQIMPLNLVYYLTYKWNGINYQYTRQPKISHAIKLGKDPKISTDIACQMLSHLYSKYRKYGKDADRFVVMAYNAGETRIDAWIRKEGPPLMPETLNYYYQLLALQEMMKDIQGSNSFGLR